MAPASTPTRTVYLRKGMKFNAIVGRGKGKGGKVQRKRHVGPCAVDMTEAQIVSFRDILQTQPQTIVEEPPRETESEPIALRDETEPETETN